MSQVHQRLTAHPHDRIAVRRTDAEWLASRWSDPRTRVLVVAGTRVLPTPHGVTWVSPAEAPAGTRLLLGERDGTAYFAVVVPDEVATDEWRPLRGVLQTLATTDAADAPLVLHAIGLAEWLAANRFCPRCGLPLRPVKEAHELACDNGHASYPRMDPAVIMLITAGEPGSPEERCLLGRQAAWPQRRYSTLAGFCEPGESLEDAVRREVVEETGVRVGEVTYFGNQPWPLPASLMLGFTGRAITTETRVDAVELADARWFTRAELLREAAAGTLMLPGGISISRALIESWYGAELPGSW